MATDDIHLKTRRQSDFDAATRLSFLPANQQPHMVEDAIHAWETQMRLSPLEVQDLLMRDMPTSSRLDLDRDSGYLYLSTRQIDGQHIVHSRRRFWDKEILDGSLTIHPDYRDFGYGAACVRNLIEVGSQNDFISYEILAGDDFGPHCWAGIFEPCQSVTTQKRYIDPVKKRIRILLPFIPESEREVIQCFGHFLNMDMPGRTLMGTLANLSFDLRDILHEEAMFSARHPLYKTFLVKGPKGQILSNTMPLALQRSSAHGAQVHTGRFLTITTRWDGRLDLQDPASYQPAVAILNNRVKRGRARAQAKGLSL